MNLGPQDDPIPVSRSAVRFPIELRLPPGFRPEEPSTWPAVEGRVEFVGGRLLFMPPCGDVQQDVCVDLIGLLHEWSTHHPEFVVGGNEAGMLLGDEIRGADGAVWRRSDLGPRTGGFRRVAPVLAAEVAGLDEGEVELREKAKWYFAHGVSVVWLVLPGDRGVLVLSPDSEQRFSGSQPLNADARLPGLQPRAEEFFRQLGPP
ncbi:MAG: Uma2 family endonuclease [Myxococcaceae bacterium]